MLGLGKTQFSPVRADDLERPGRAAAFGEHRALEHPGAGVDERGFRRRHVRARQDPVQSCAREERLALPTAYLDNLQLRERNAFGGQELRSEEARELAYGHAVLL